MTESIVEHHFEPARLALASDVDAFMRLDVVDRFRTLVTGENFPAELRAEPIVFPVRDPIFGYACGVPDCARQLARASNYCQQHEKERKGARNRGVSEPDWLASATPGEPRGLRTAVTAESTTCIICPGRAATANGLCTTHRNGLDRRRKWAAEHGVTFDYDAWLARQVPSPDMPVCVVVYCIRRSESARTEELCFHHWRRFRTARKGDPSLDRTVWIAEASERFNQGAVALDGLPTLLEAEIRYGIYAHAEKPRPAKWFPGWLRALAAGVRVAGVESLTELQLTGEWCSQVEHVNRIVKEMLKDIAVVHTTRLETRAAGYIDPLYWGFQFKNRRSPFDLRGVSQDWLREATWDHLSAMFDSQDRPRTAGPVEARRRAVYGLSAFLHDRVPQHGNDPTLLSPEHARSWVADFTRRVRDGLPMLGSPNMDGSPSPATQVSKVAQFNSIRAVLRSMLEDGSADRLGIDRRFITFFPYGGRLPKRRPRPLNDSVFDALTNAQNTGWLSEECDPNDLGLEDIWFIQARCGRRISEVVNLRFDCVTQHSGRTWAWFDMTKVDHLDYAVQIPKHVHEVILARQAKTAERYRLATGSLPTGKTARSIALFPGTTKNPHLTQSIATTTFSTAFKRWIRHLDHDGVVPHQARHTLATRLRQEGASLEVIRMILGHVSEEMSQNYTHLASTAAEPFLQKVWVRGPGSSNPGEVIMTPNDSQASRAHDVLLDLTALPTEGGICTFRPVVGGADCLFGRQCDRCEHQALTGADYSYWKRQEQRWTQLAEAAPDDTTRDYIYAAYAPSSQALVGLERALTALGLLEQAKQVDLRNPHQDFFDPIWSHGWRSADLIAIGEADAVELPDEDDSDSALDESEVV